MILRVLPVLPHRPLAVSLFFTFALTLAILSAAEDPGPGPNPATGTGTGTADTPSTIDWQQLQADEDRIDALPAGEQGPALLDLRRRINAAGTPAAQKVLQRLNLKLSFAAAQTNLTADADHPAPYADRLALSKQAAEIGGTYLKQNDPARALRWEAKSRACAAESLWPDDLRNQIHAWHEQRLTHALDAALWVEARTELTAWQKEMGADTAVSEGVNLYAQARAADLIQSLDTVDPRTVLSRLTAEEAATPGAAAWTTVRDRVAATLDRDFQHSLSARDIAGARTALELQTAIAAEYRLDAKHAPVAANTSLYEALVRDLQPSPIQRQYGQVHAVQFRIEVMEAIGVQAIRHGNIAISGFSWHPYAVGDWRIYANEEAVNWFGFNMTGLGSGLSKDFQSGSRFQSQFFFLFGRRGTTWSGSLGVGAIYNNLTFVDGPSKTMFASTTVSAGLRLDIEQIMGERWTVYGTLIVGQGSGVSCWEFKAGWRYYFNHNFCVGLHTMLTEIDVGASGTIPSFYMTARTLGPTMMMQF
ncbi:MAG TPA: hypothetical protein VL860_09305 [Planctomycetota bacterium]|nr:hypothetical protein [Planctomycetota bacterium]